ncbi:MAG: LPS export ABC transporter periplasmic protein LptC [Candidatus Latescibacterota bacterium]|nr:MAG: LPS export ABC transporter periplasmic protein LptC [Candidatus Latescibacterota bacterium]
MRWSARKSKLAVTVVVLVAFFALGCADEPTQDITFDKNSAPDEVFADFVTQESDSGMAQWRLTAPHAKRYKDKKLIVLEKPTIEFYDENGAVRTTLDSDNGEYYEDRRDLLAYGNVVVKSVDGDVLETDSLLWDNKKGKILSHSFVKLTRGRDVITGYGMECNDDLNSVDIKRDVKATVIDEDGEIVP